MGIINIDKDKLKELYENNTKIDEIAKYFKCSKVTISNKLKKYNIPIRKPYINIPIGTKFGDWTVIAYGKKSKAGTLWLCSCKCGQQQLINIYVLRHNKSTMCRKCVHNSMLNTTEFRDKHMNIYKKQAVERDILFDLDKDYLWDLFIKQDRKCALSGEEIVFAIGHRNHQHGKTTASLDRIDSSKGYIKGNVQWVHKEVNYMKRHYPEERFIYLCQRVADVSRAKVPT